jgi:hypothetical protein
MSPSDRCTLHLPLSLFSHRHRPRVSSCIAHLLLGAKAKVEDTLSTLNLFRPFTVNSYLTLFTYCFDWKYCRMSKSMANGSSAGDDKGASTIPRVAQIWRYVYHAVPKVNFPFTNLPMSFSLASAAFLFTLRMMTEPLLISVFHWPEGATPTKESAASMVSICHSSLLCLGLIVSFQTQTYRPSQKLVEAPLWWQEFVDALIQFCTGYMIYDAIFNVILLRWSPGDRLPTFGLDDYLFLGHHIVTSTYMISTRVIKAGHMSAMMCMLLGELTNPLHNLYMISNNALTLDNNCCNGELSQQLFTIISVSFAAMYFFFRVLFAPFFFLHITYDLLITKQGRTNIPLALNIFWNLMIWAVVFGSISWIQKCLGILVDFASVSAGVAAVAKEEL